MKPLVKNMVRRLFRNGSSRSAARASRRSFRPDVELMERRDVPAASFFAPAAIVGSVDVQLVPLADVTAGVQEIVTFGVPFTRGSVTDAQLSQIRVTHNGVEIPAFVDDLTPWRSIDDAAIDGQSVRVARIQIPYTFASLNSETITVSWGGAARTLNRTSMQDPRIEWHTVTSGSFVAADNVQEPDVLPVLPAAYLAQGMLDSPTTPANVTPTRDDPAAADAATFSGFTEYDSAEKNFFYTIINQNGQNVSTPIDYKTDPEPWLYDRSAGMYELYMHSGNATALREAIRSTDFYADHLDANGFFTLKPGDPKYSYNESLAYTYWLLGDNSMLAPISKVVNAFDDTQTHWTPDLSFWTERNSGDKLLATEMAYEVTGNATFKASVQTIVGDFIWHQNGAGGQLPANRIDGGLYHYGEQHDLDEVSSPTVLVASSWMSALIVDPMVRVYGVWENNAQIPDFIIRMGNFEKAASLTDADGQFGGIHRYPDYLMRPDGTPDNRSDTDVQHAMDVGAVAAWATYFAAARGTPDASLRQLATDLYSTYEVGVNFWTSTADGFEVEPPRRYNWEYKNSASFAWALDAADAPGQAGLFRFGAPSFSVVENQTVATITVTRTHGSTGVAAVNYATSNGTALAGSDYTATSGTLTFADGETTKTFTIPITNDTLVENAETVNLTLSNPTGGAALDSPASATLRIDSDDTTSTPITATYQQGVGGYTGTTDADFSNQYVPNGATTVDGDQLGVYQTADYSIEGLVRFDNLGISTHAATDATVTNATATFTVDFGDTTSTIRGFYLLRPWSVAEGSEIGWLHTGTGVDWSVPGAQGQGTDVVAGKSFILTGVGVQTITVPLDSAIVQGWIDNPASNNGFVLVNQTPGSTPRVFASETSNAAQRPKLSISYTVGASTFPGSLQFASSSFSVNENAGTATITVTRTGGSTGAVTVHYATSDGPATAGNDYVATSGTLTFADGEVSKTFTVPILEDDLVENGESFNVTLSAPTGGSALGTQATALVNIIDDDVAQPGALQFSGPTFSVIENQGTATITVTRTGGSNVAVTVHYATSDGSAVAGNDYTATSGTLTFGVGDTQKTFTVPILDDQLVEGNETINLSLSAPTDGATLGSQTKATLTIVDNDTTGTIAAAYQQGVNGYSGTTDVAITTQNAQFTGGNGITDFNDSQLGLYQLSGTGGYAVEDLVRFGNLGIAPGAAVVSATVTLSIDSFIANPTIRGYYVAAPWSGTPGSDSTQLGWIHRGTGQNWAVPGALGQGTDVVAGKSFVLPTILGNGTQSVTIALDPAVVQSWIDNPSADQGILLVNETTGAVVHLNTSENSNASLRPKLAINYNTSAAQPGSLQFSAAAYTVNEQDGTATITVTRTGGSSGPVTIDYATSNGTAAAGSDYTATSGTLTFAAGETQKTFTIPILDDALVEANETVNLTLTNPTGGAVLGGQTTASLTIVSDDTAQPGVLQFSAASYSVSENGGTATITVTRSGGSDVPVTIAYATSNGTATAGSDYTATSGTLTFGVGETQKTFTVPITNDTLVEGNETVNLTLSSPSGGATLGAQATATLTIQDDDVAQPGVVQFSGASYSVGETQGTATITVTRTGTANVPVTVAYATSNGTATAGSDYTATSGTLTFGVGETQKTFTVPITNDTLVEGNETVNLTLSSPSGGATLGAQATATLTIQDDDIAQPGVVQFSVAGYSVAESQATATITVTRTNGANVPVTVAYATSNGTATAGSDYTATSGTLSFGVGETQKTFTVPITNDTLAEGNETVNLTLSSPSGGAMLGAQATATLTIQDDDIAPSGTVTLQQGVNGYGGTTDVDISTQYGQYNGGNGTTSLTDSQLGVYKLAGSGGYTTEGLIRFANLGIAPGSTVASATLTLSVESWVAGATIRGYYIQAPWSTTTTGNSALGWIHRGTGQNWATAGALGQGTDVVAGKSFVISGITATGTQSKTITLDPTIVQSWIDNPAADQGILLVNETTGAVVRINASENTNVALRPKLSIAFSGGTTTTPPQPGAVQFSAAAYSVAENGGTATITVTRSAGSNVPIAVNYATSNGTATAGSDYTATSGTLTFAANETTKTFTVPITNDTAVEPNETIHLTLSNPTGGATLGGQSTATLTIQDDDVVALQSITMTPTNPSIVNGQTSQFTVTGHFSDGSSQVLTSGVGYSSSNVGVATVSASGLASAVGVGTTTITATDGSFTSGTTLTVTAVPVVTLQSITMTPTNPSIVNGQTSQFTVTGHFSDGSSQTLTSGVGYSSSNVGVATVSASGLASAVGVGTTTITATDGSFTSGTALTVTAVPVATLQSITMTPTNPSIVNGQTSQFTVTGHFSDGSSQILTSGVGYSSSNVGVATVSASGLASAVGVGTTTITATDGSFTSGTTLTVTAVPNAPTVGVHTLAFTHFGAPAGTLSASPITTQASGSTVLAFVGRGAISSFSPATAPRDNLGNVGVQLDTTHSYAPNFPNSGMALYSFPSFMGGAGDIFSAPMPVNDEVTMMVVEIKNGGVIQDEQFNVAPNSPQTSLSVTTTGPATLVAFWTGDAASGAVSATPNNGFTVIESELESSDAVQASVAVKDVAAAGTYNVTWSAAPAQTAYMWLVAIQHGTTPAPQPGKLALSASSSSVNEAAGTATFTVNRTGGSDGPVAVHYATSNGTATAGSDYTATSGNLTFAAGETQKTFTVPITNDTAVEGNETFNVTLSNPTGGATLGTPATEVATILDDDVAPPPPPSGAFTDVTDSSGIGAIINQKLAEDPNWWMTGQHLVDLDNDGDLDLFLDAHNGTSVVALNDGHGHFTRVTDGSWPSTEIHEMADINGDGKIDLSATFDDGGAQWWINNSTPGHVNFTPTSVTREGNSAREQVLMDFNGDGNVDWVRSAEPGMVIDYGNGHGGFTEGSVSFPIAGTTNNDNASFIPGDFDGDGKTDILVLTGGGYDGTVGTTAVWHNNGNGTFTDVTASSGLPANGTVVKGVGDVNQDGKIDLIAVENLSMPPVIYLNDGNGHFTKKAGAISGVAPETLDYSAWGTAVVTDFDNDGIPDIIMDGKYYLKVLRGTGGGNFTYMNDAWNIKDTAASAVDDGLSFGDIDGDGRLDIIGYNETFPTRTVTVYHNDVAGQNNWINVRPVGLAGNVGAAGAKISIFAAGTNQLLSFEQVAQYDFQVATSSYGTSQTERHYGLGTRTKVDIVVTFASGKTTRLDDVSADQTIDIFEQ